MKLSNRARNLIVVALGLIFISYCGYCLLMGSRWIDRPFPGFVFLNNKLVPTVNLPRWEGFAKGIRFGDIIVKADGVEFADGDAISDYVAGKAPGTVVTYSVRRGDAMVEIAVPVAVFTPRDWALLFPTLISFGLMFYAIGLAVFFLRPNAVASRVFLGFCVVAGLNLAGAPEYITTHTFPILLITLPLIGPSFMLFANYFPEANKRRKIYLALSFGSAAPIIVLYVALFHQVGRFVIVDMVMLVHLVSNNILATYVMARAFYTSENELTRQRGKVVILGLSLTLAGAMAFVIGHLIFKVMALFWLLPVAVIILPISIAYAIVKHNLFDVDLIIRRSISYGLVSLVALVLFFGLSGFVSVLLQGVTGLSSQIAAVVSTLVVVALFRPLHTRVGDSIERRFFGERYEYQQTIAKASKVLARIIDKDRLLKELLDTIIDSVKIERGLILLWDEDSDTYRLASERGHSIGANPHPRDEAPKPPEEGTGRPINLVFEDDGESDIVTLAAERDHAIGFVPGDLEEEEDEDRSFELSSQTPLLFHLQSMRRALQLSEVKDANVFGREQEPMLETMNSLGLELVVPISYEFRMIGVLGLGPKKNGAWYSSDDIDILQTLMAQAAISIENARSVEEMKRMVEMETSYRELKNLDQMKDNILSMVSHDLRTPMTAILAYACIIRDGIDEIGKSDQMKYLDTIIEQCERMTRLINDLLDIQRFEAGKMTLEFSELELNKVVLDTVRLFEGAAAEKRINLVRKDHHDPIMVRGVRDRLQQVVSNLISNALKFTPEDGKVAVMIEVLDDHGGAAARVVIADNGPGIPRKYQASLFDKFQQGDKLIREKQQGSGLGLALVKEIVKAHEGRVGLKSTVGKGSSFYFVLPVLSVGDSN